MEVSKELQDPLIWFDMGWNLYRSQSRGLQFVKISQSYKDEDKKSQQRAVATSIIHKLIVK